MSSCVLHSVNRFVLLDWIIWLQQTIVHEWNRDGRWQDLEDVFRAAAHDTECPELVKEGR